MSRHEEHMKIREHFTKVAQAKGTFTNSTDQALVRAVTQAEENQMLREINEQLTTDLFKRIECNGVLVKQNLDAVKEIERLNNQICVYKVVDEFVKEQAKKVKHLFPLENTPGYGQLCDLVVEQVQQIESLQKENERLREALEFYASDDNWQWTIELPIGEGSYCSEVDLDKGKIAHQALAGETHDT